MKIQKKKNRVGVGSGGVGVRLGGSGWMGMEN